MYVFFLGVVPFISISLLLMYYWKQNRPWFIAQTPTNEYVPNCGEHVVKAKLIVEITDKKLIFCTNPTLLSSCNEIA